MKKLMMRLMFGKDWRMVRRMANDGLEVLEARKDVPPSWGYDREIARKFSERPETAREPRGSKEFG